MRWGGDLSDKERVFIEDVIKLSRQRGFSIGHEDGHGAFQIVPYNEVYSNWLRDAICGRETNSEVTE